MPDKVDLKKTLDSYRAKRDVIRELTVERTRYLMVDGHGDPNTSDAFSRAIEAIFPVAYKAKFASKQELGRDYVVMPLEGLWSAPDMTAFTSRRDKSAWDWTLMILQPDWVDDALIERAITAAGAKDAPARLDDVRVEALEEGRCLQTLHLGSFDDEGPVLERMHAQIADQGLAMAGRHHEIYLSDFRKVAPERLRTILRQPVAPA
ncbi:GyrI-like domain-containing protein [Demequina gelatinilytica]|uniref:GyrI-like domain-containing protein n=1 Tax=Demequina gelatinilytica TaxID=1638980 RepID=UPI000782ADCE|nr:GyrI-like domain-containing protein [Demequina gelatinilytica]